MTRPNDSSLIRSSKVSSVIPAFDTRISTGPCSASTAVKAASTSSAEVTSQRTPKMPSGAPLPRCVIATLSPFAANARAIARPMPRLPPVTSTERLTGPTLADRPLSRPTAATAG